MHNIIYNYYHKYGAQSNMAVCVITIDLHNINDLWCLFTC